MATVTVDVLLTIANNESVQSSGPFLQICSDNTNIYSERTIASSFPTQHTKDILSVRGQDNPLPTMLSLARQIVSKSARAVVAGRAVTTSVVAAETSAGPSIKDFIVTLTFVDPSGARRKVPAVVGT